MSAGKLKSHRASVQLEAGVYGSLHGIITADATGLARVRNLHVLSDRGLPAVNDLSLEVRAGEILGIAGETASGGRPGY